MDHYKLSAKYYDKIYSFKKYEAETEKVKLLFEKHSKIEIQQVLEVACGTGNYLSFLQKDYEVEGIDISPSMVEVAQKKLPKLKILQGDMRNFQMNKQYDAVLCLFSSIAYMLNAVDLQKAINCIVAHLKPGGILIIEPFVQKEHFTVGHLGVLNHEWDDMKISRHNTTALDENDICSMDLHHLVTTKAEGVQYFVEPHQLWLIPQKLLLNILQENNLNTNFIKDGIVPNRGLFIATKT